MYGSMRLQTILQVSDMNATVRPEKCLQKTGRRICTWSEKILFDFIRFTGQFSWWLWIFLCRSRSLVIRGWYRAMVKWVNPKEMCFMRMNWRISLGSMPFGFLYCTRCRLTMTGWFPGSWLWNAWIQNWLIRLEIWWIGRFPWAISILMESYLRPAWQRNQTQT